MNENNVNLNRVDHDGLQEKNKLQGLGGWLILVGIGLIFSPIRIMNDLISIVQQLIDIPWDEYAKVAPDVFNPMLKTLIIGEIVVNSIFIILSVLLIILFFKKHYLFPKVYIAYFVASLMIIPLDSYLVTQIIPAEEVFDPETFKETIRVLIACLIWVPYMLVSKRVKNTFVEGRKTA